ncbi:MAG TPA: hypothetical protein VFR09_00060 [Alphaproteobacteria bacterium]|nr:hypothetical protein [Alphaproteobacteria bacterium]
MSTLSDWDISSHQARHGQPPLEMHRADGWGRDHMRVGTHGHEDYSDAFIRYEIDPARNLLFTQLSMMDSGDRIEGRSTAPITNLEDGKQIAALIDDLMKTHVQAIDPNAQDYYPLSELAQRHKRLPGRYIDDTMDSAVRVAVIASEIRQGELKTDPQSLIARFTTFYLGAPVENPASTAKITNVLNHARAVVSHRSFREAAEKANRNQIHGRSLTIQEPLMTVVDLQTILTLSGKHTPVPGKPSDYVSSDLLNRMLGINNRFASRTDKVTFDAASRLIETAFTEPPRYTFPRLSNTSYSIGHDNAGSATITLFHTHKGRDTVETFPATAQGLSFFLSDLTNLPEMAARTDRGPTLRTDAAMLSSLGSLIDAPHTEAAPSYPAGRVTRATLEHTI